MGLIHTSINPIRTLTYRCLRIYSSTSFLQSAVKNLLWRNGYPRGVITYKMNDAVARNRSKPKDPITTVPKRDVYIVLPYLGLQSKIITKQVKSCIYKVYGCINLKVIFRNTHLINSLFPLQEKV